jgi:hypothetical protein
MTSSAPATGLTGSHAGVVGPAAMLVARADYKPSFDGAIPLTAGEKLRALSTQHALWWHVKTVPAGRVGFVPKDFLLSAGQAFMGKPDCPVFLNSLLEDHGDCLIVAGMVRLPPPFAHVQSGVQCDALTTAAEVAAAAIRRLNSLSGESKRLVVESPWSQFTSECQRF